MNRKYSRLLIACVAMSLVVSGCVAAAAAGAAAGAGGYAWASGKLTFTTAHGISEAHSATLSALKDMGIEITSDRVSTLSGNLQGVTGTNETVTIDLEPLAPDITRIDIRVGFWGNHYQESKIADAIQRHLQ